MNYIELKVEVSPLEIGRDIVVAELAEIGFESFDDFEKGVRAYIQEVDYDRDLLKQVSIFSNENFTINYKEELIEEQNWNATWEKSFEPIDVLGQCFIRAPFHDVKENFKYNIEIEPKMSFGTGHHETTHLMVEELLGMNLEGKNVLDMGCGTGVLAILCKLKGAQNVCAIDIDEWAFENTLENVERNNCNSIEVLKGGAELLDGKMFDVVIANINRNILLSDMVYYFKSMKANSEILLSGFFSSDKESLIKEASKYGGELIAEKNKNDWTLLHLNKK